MRKLKKLLKSSLTLFIIIISTLGNAKATGPEEPQPAPPGEGDPIYEPGRIFVDFGVHIGVYDYGYGSGLKSLTPLIPVTADVEVGVFDFIGIGGYFSMATRKYEYSYTDWDRTVGYHTDVHERRYTHTSFGAKGVFHVIPFLNKTFNFDHNLDGSKYDLYITHYVGIRVTSSKWVNESDVDDDIERDFDRDAVPVFFNPTAGARYMFTDFFGAYAEVGYGHWGGSDIEGGLSLRF